MILISFKVNLTKNKNAFGKNQSDVDLEADAIIFKHLKECGCVYAAASEEQPKVSALMSSFCIGKHP